MPVYSLIFSEELTFAASALVDKGIESLDSQRAVLYLSLVSCEISLKALLEKAGMSVPHLRSQSHKLHKLLLDFSDCEIEAEVVSGTKSWVAASKLRAVTVDSSVHNATVGHMLQAESEGASIYPNDIRYGDLLTHYPAELVLKMAVEIISWAKENWDSIRIKSA